jgi:hypothetical protein
MAQYQNPGLPSNLYAGAAVKVDTRPIANLIYQEQRYQQAKAQKEDAALNEEKAANVAKIRDADVPDFVNQYQQYATAKRRLMNDTRLRKDPQAYAAAQMEVAGLYGSAMKLANESRQARDLYEHVDKDRFTHPENYVEDYFDKRSTINKTPLSRLRQVQTGVDPTGQPIYVDYSSPDVLVDNTPHYDFSKAINDVKGKPTYTGFQTKKNLDEKGLQYETSAALYGAAPKKVFAGIMDKIASDKQAYRTAVKGGKEITPEIWDDMVRQYKAVLPEEWQKRGLKLDEQDVTKLFHPENQAEKFAAFKTMQDFVTSKVEFEAPKKGEDSLLKLQMQNNAAMDRLRQSHQYRLDEIKAKATHTGKEVQTVVNKEMGDLLEYAKNNPVSYVDVEGGQSKTGYDLPLTESVITAAQKQKGENINAVRYVKKDGKDMIYVVKYRPIIDDQGYITGYETNKKNGKPIIDVSQSRYMPLNIYKNQYAKDMFKGKLLQGEMGEDIDVEDIDMEDVTDDSGGGRPTRTTKPVKATTGKAGISWQK